MKTSSIELRSIPSFFILSRSIELFAPVSKIILEVFSTSARQEKSQSALRPLS